MNLPNTTYRFIFHFVRQQKFKFLLFVLGSAIWAINDTFFPYFLKRIVNIIQHYQGAPLGIYAAVKGVLGLLILFWVVSEILQRTQGFMQVLTFPRFRAQIRAAVFNYVQAHSHDYFSSHFAGTIAKKLADLPNSCQAVMEIICFQFVTALMGAIMVLGMMHPVPGFVINSGIRAHLV